MEDQQNAIRAFMYFTTNFTPNFVYETFGAKAHHLQSKWRECYSRYGSTDALPRFYRELSHDNQDTLSAFILTTYKP